MKKLISAVLVLLCIASLTGCGIKGKEVLYIEFNEWKMQAVILNKIEQGIINGSMSASLEESSDFYSGDARCSVRVFERYSYSGGNRVSLSVTLFQNGNDAIHLSAITTGGSQAMFFKINTFGEEAFLDKLRELL